MAYELFYTSVPKGLRPLTSGICTVGMTAGFPAPFIPRLEALSGYRPPFDGAPLSDCPVAYSHWIIEAAGVTRHILASVRATKPDHTLRSNKLAHYLLLRESELSKMGPAWILSQPGVMSSEWFGEPREFEAEKILPENNTTDCVRCDAWEKLTGDAGWAGVIANSAMLDSTAPCSIVYPKGTEVLQLVHEALLLIPPEWRWRVTFSTYFMDPLAGLRCAWRFCMDGTPAASAARQSPGLTVDLCIRAKCTRNGQFIDAARTGKNVALRRDRVSGSESDFPQGLSTEFLSAKSSIVRDPNIQHRDRSVSDPTRQNDFGFRANFERKWKATNFAAGFLFAVITVLIFLFLTPWRVQSQFESPLATEQSGIVKPQDPQKVITQPLVDATSNESLTRALDAERLRSQQMTVDSKRAIDEAYAKNKILQAKLEIKEKEVLAARAFSEASISTPMDPELPTVPSTSPSAESDFLSSMPTKASDWKVQKLAKPTKDKFGSLEGTTECTFGAKIDRIVWFPQRIAREKTKKFFGLSESGDKILLHFNGRSEQVASVVTNEKKLSLTWTASSATLNLNPSIVKDLQEDLRSTALIICMGRVFEWYIFDTIPKFRLEPNKEKKLDYLIASNGFHYSMDGNPWVPFKNGVVDIPIPSETGNVGNLKFKASDLVDFLSVEFEYPELFDKEKLEQAEEDIKKFQEEFDSAQTEFEKYDGVLARFSESHMMYRKEAKVASDTAKLALENAQNARDVIKDSQSNFLASIEKTRILVGPTNAVPIAEIQIKNTKVQQKSE